MKKDYNTLALARAEQLGVYVYTVKGSKIIYYSYFGRGYIKVTYDLETGKETRKHQKGTKFAYNYYVG